MQKEEKFNPFEIQTILDERWQKDYYYKQMSVFTIMKEQADMMSRIKQKQELVENDLEYRDVIFKNTLKEEEQFPNYFYWAQQHLSESRGIDGYSKYSEVVKKCQRRKMEFWKKYSNMPPTTEDKEKTKKIISKILYFLPIIQLFQVKWEYKGPSVATFFGLTIATMFIMNIAKGSPQSKAILFCLGTFSGNIYADFRNYLETQFDKYFIQIDSENIFNNIPQLPDEETELQKQKIINYCFPVDIQLMSKAFLD